jgi:hypothetical protein
MSKYYKCLTKKSILDEEKSMEGISELIILSLMICEMIEMIDAILEENY